MVFAARTDVGVRRQNNEDAYIVNCDGENAVFIVADGMGGHNAGEIASLEACRIVESAFASDEGNTEAALVRSVQKANRDIFIRASENESQRGMGTTVDACVIKDGMLYIAHVGDSRVYVIESDKMRKVTHDHSVVGMMIDSGNITEEEARFHPQRNLITRAVGTAITVEVDIEKEDIHNVRWILMCTDGLTNMVPKTEIESIIISARNVDEAADRLVERAKQMGGDDNITLILIDLSDEKGGVD